MARPETRVAILLAHTTPSPFLLHTACGAYDAHPTAQSPAAGGLAAHSDGLPALRRLKADGLPALRRLKADGLPALRRLKADGLPALRRLKADGLPALRRLKADGLPALRRLKADGLPGGGSHHAPLRVPPCLLHACTPNSPSTLTAFTTLSVCSTLCTEDLSRLPSPSSACSPLLPAAAPAALSPSGAAASRAAAWWYTSWRNCETRCTRAPPSRVERRSRACRRDLEGGRAERREGGRGGEEREGNGRVVEHKRGVSEKHESKHGCHCTVTQKP